MVGWKLSSYGKMLQQYARREIDVCGGVVRASVTAYNADTAGSFHVLLQLLAFVTGFA